MPDLYFESTDTGKRYKVLSHEPTTGLMRLKGPNGIEFEVTYSKETFQRWNYRPVQDAAAPAPPAPLPPPPSA